MGFYNKQGQNRMPQPGILDLRTEKKEATGGNPEEIIYNDGFKGKYELYSVAKPQSDPRGMTKIYK